MLIDRARSEGLQLTGEGGLLQQLTKRVLESALEGEITDHLGCDKHEAAGKNSGNSRNGTRAKQCSARRGSGGLELVLRVGGAAALRALLKAPSGPVVLPVGAVVVSVRLRGQGLAGGHRFHFADVLRREVDVGGLVVAGSLCLSAGLAPVIEK
ncbi:transposase [Streptomyces sp. NBC_00873]|nr:transposase [Streptomyces sp. NBC_00873]WSY97401.1 transposase [Streptomyces sp. NBC_00873]WTA48604.1 transposase [Streptomyces sp. NBC_00842]WTA49070.1 transposase [Streptomyces sp. NBC_00842]